MSDTLTAQRITFIKNGGPGVIKFEEWFDLCDLALRGLQRPDLEAAVKAIAVQISTSGRAQPGSYWMGYDNGLRCAMETVRALATGQDAQVQGECQAYSVAVTPMEQGWHCPQCGDVSDTDRCPRGLIVRQAEINRAPTGQDAQNAARRVLVVDGPEAGRFLARQLVKDIAAGKVVVPAALAAEPERRKNVECPDCLGLGDRPTRGALFGQGDPCLRCNGARTIPDRRKGEKP